jgi:glycerol-3-phosphate O-acyltransferase
MADAPIFGFNHAKTAIVEEVVQRVAGGIKDPLLSLNDAAYLELKRLAHSHSQEAQEWRALARELGRMTDAELRGKVEELARHYAWDVAGNFDKRVFKMVTRLGVPVLGGLMAPRATLKGLAHALDMTALDGRVLVQGPRETIRRLADRGTLVFTPTHLSNLDSVVFGFALERAGLPPATYGAGKNLFSNPVLSFFMHNLGAYRVDRRLRHALYKDVLKSYSSVLIERGYHSLFFPGGTRCRSGGVERKLKLGLAGTGIEAFSRTAVKGKAQKVFFVPATINYLLTLEAETLIDDYLAEEGKHRYIIDDDESTRVSRIASFMQKLLGLDAACVIRFGQPLDCFGNAVDDEGTSHDSRGRPIDMTSFIMGRDDKPCRDAARDAQYTRELGEAICVNYKKDTVLMATHLTATVAFDKIIRSTGHSLGRMDIYAMLRQKDDVIVPRAQLAEDIDLLVAKIKPMEARGEIVLSAGVKGCSGEAILSDALRAFAGYHTSEVIVPRGPDLVLADTRLLFYYQNRLAAHGLSADLIAPKRTSRVAA